MSIDFDEHERVFQSLTIHEIPEVRVAAHAALTHLLELRELTHWKHVGTPSTAEAFRHLDDLTRNLNAAYQNLTATQRRCTALTNENRELRRQLEEARRG